MLDRVVETGRPQISDLIIGALLARPFLSVGVPVFREGKIAFVLAMGLGPELLSALLNEQNLPTGWNAGIFDRKYLIVAHHPDPGRIVGHPAMPALRAQISKSLEGWFPSVTKNGIDVYSAFRRSPISGWTVAIGLPREFVDAPLRRTQWLVFGGGGTACAMSLALAWWMARAIRRPVESLTATARALGNGEPARHRSAVSVNSIRSVMRCALPQLRSNNALMLDSRPRRRCGRAKSGFACWPSRCRSWCGPVCRTGAWTI